jgi:hypothetical protein
LLQNRPHLVHSTCRPWHVFVDTSPNTDADFEVAATFDEEPTLDEVNFAIVECLEGSEKEDEIVAQQMQQALEEGQLDKVSEMLEGAFEMLGGAFDAFNDDDDDEDEDEDDEDDFDMYEEDSV